MIKLDAQTRKTLREMNRYDWSNVWSFVPRRCKLTGTKIKMFSKAYRGYRIIDGPGECLVMTRWISEETFIFESLKGNL